ncbi:MAG: restriction endonuclease [Anaerolineales bacterium]|nr:restriction endonuclease [Anaerolineales bacterium]
MSPLTLPEYQPLRIPRAELRDEWGMKLYRQYAPQIQAEPPSLADDAWNLTNLGWAGYIPLGQGTGLFLQPKVPLANLFGMMGYAYRLGEFLDAGVYQSASVGEFYEQLAYILARRVLARARQGLYREYVPKTETLPYIRGRLVLQPSSVFRLPSSVLCHFHEHTANIEDNQILAWTLHTIARSGLLTPRVAPTVRAAYRAISTTLNASLAGAGTLNPVAVGTLSGRSYTRLNPDYRGLHALCRFFLDHVGPQHQAGDQAMIPFLVEMARLFEQFVAEWLRGHLPEGMSLRVQERVALGEAGDLHARVDLVLYDETGRASMVLDTKYKTPDHPAPEEVFQVAGYADLKGCGDAFLVYPVPLKRPLDVRVGDVRVRSAVFPLEGDLEQAGRHFLAIFV